MNPPTKTDLASNLLMLVYPAGRESARNLLDGLRVPQKSRTIPSIIEGLMKPRITLLTLGVDDLDRALAFYRDGLGFPTEGIVGQEYEHGAVAFFELQPGLGLALWPRASLARDTGLSQSAPSPTDLSIAHNVNSREEVVAVLEEARAAGAKIVKEAGDTFWGGFAGYFQDPDGHLWEIAWNPQLPVPD